MAIERPTKLYDFGKVQVAPAYEIDRQFDNHKRSIDGIIKQLSKVVRADGKLHDEVLTPESFPKQTLEKIEAAALSEARRVQAEAAELLREVKLREARIEATAKELRALIQKNLGDNQTTRRLGEEVQVSHAKIKTELADKQTQTRDWLADVDNAQNEVLRQAAVAEDWANVSIAWAEYMPWTIPPNILATNAITGEHWSSRWWAHRAGEYVNGLLVGYYMGPFPNPPLMTATGAPIPVGSIYFNTSNNQPYIFDGTDWIPFTTPQKAATSSLFYEATAGQTSFPLTAMDLFGNSITGLDPSGDEGIEVWLNGVRLTPDGAGFVGDFTVDYATSSIVLAQPVPVASLLAVDVLLPPSQLAPAQVTLSKLQPITPDGVLTTFDLIDAGGAPVLVSSAAQLLVILDGVSQEPGVDFQIGANASSIEFAAAPTADAHSFIVLMGNSMVPGNRVTHDASLFGDGTVTNPLGVVFTEADARATFVEVAGDVMTGNLTLPAVIFDNGGPIWAMGTAGQDFVVTRSTLGGVYVDTPLTVANPQPPVAGGAQFEFAGAVLLDREPSVPSQATTKNYVDLLVTGAQQFIGSFNAATGQAVFTTASGVTPNPGPLPPGLQIGANCYVIVEVSGTPTVGPPETQVQVEVGDWWISDGSAWSLLAVGSPSAVLASNVGLAPSAFGASDVQTALNNAETTTTGLETNKVAKAGDVMLGPLGFNFNGPGNALMFSGGAEIYAAAATQTITLRRGAGDTQPQIMNAAGTVGNDIVDTQTGDARYVNLTGDSMTGTLVLQNGLTLNPNSPPVAPAGIDMNGGSIGRLADPVNPQDAATKNYIDTQSYVPIAGGTMTGSLNFASNGLGLLWPNSVSLITTAPNQLQANAGTIVLNGALSVTGVATMANNVLVQNAVNAGIVQLVPGTTAQSGYISFHTPDGTRRGYIGYASGNINHITAENGYNWRFDQPISGQVTIQNGRLDLYQSGGYYYRWIDYTNAATGSTPVFTATNNSGSRLWEIDCSHTSYTGYGGPEGKLWLYCSNGGYGWNWFMQSNVGPSTSFNGTVYASVSAPSDSKLKSAVTPVDFDEVDAAFKAFNPVRYKLKPQRDRNPLSATGYSDRPMPDPNRVHWGLLADDVEIGAPDLVTLADYTQHQDFDGNPIENAEPNMVKAYDVAGVLAIAIAKIKQLEARVKELER
jgi:hypothetical protein